MLDEKLDRQLLNRPIPPSHVHARKQLEDAGIKVRRIIAANPEAILFVNESGRVITAWSEVKLSKVAFLCEPGMPAWPSEEAA
jgi:hypothetical protein